MKREGILGTASLAMTARKDFPFPSLLGKENGGKPARPEPSRRAFMVRRSLSLPRLDRGPALGRL
ncbi:MAG TPA: hypothetical protein VNN20_11495 [Thermodesulfobacteriota bacterium]|nr:hypothetical protein [Thermodesulfobacteriota bacterium]